ncbi:N-acetylmuramoyl-L-alanine amidase [Pedobacter aquatilis]|uniref:N-acetylmuramoyl-L-alanine amidase n=1 Tax=Pedobacter aquatilis TaxID=351343 RepID=UPI0025B51F6E|nr:N-acetylmuramoyl-L-alanine amidase [Pedobacter aquatilis]MDN3585475.1 N-acetylmuramoyl-L-alanine amidase [Pedobacter aquatilis]
MILIYLLKVSACIAIFFAAYKLLLSKLTFFKLNRIYLLTTLFISFVIPVLTIEHKKEVIVHQTASEQKIVYSNDNAFEKDFVGAESGIDNINWLQVLEYSYYFIIAVLLIRNIFLMGYIQRILKKFTVSKKASIILVQPNSKIKNCSFFNKIIIDSSLPDVERELVIKHESVHVNQVHVIDKLIINAVACVLWLNPIIYFWRNEIYTNHEFLADEETVEMTDKSSYAKLLLQLAMPSNNLINSFSKLPLKKRIMMMYKKPNSKLQRLTYLIAIPVISICCLAFVNQKEIITTKVITKQADIKKDNGLVNTKTLILPNTNALINLDANIIKNDTAELANQNFLSHVMDNNLGLDAAREKLGINAEIKKLALGNDLVLVIDAGHGGQDGASKSESGIREKDLNLKAAQILREEADKRNIKVVLTRDRDKFIPLRDRLPKETATAFISIHHNSMPKAGMKIPFEGIEIFVSKLNPNIKYAERFGSNVLQSLNKLSGIEVRDSLKNANLLVLRESKVPALVVELGNISSEKSLAYVSDEANLRRISNLILDGFVKFSKS